ncbi:MAG: Xaa-Pro peptidase family protein [Pseudomonadota bacterium]
MSLPRGFPDEEYHARLARAQEMLAEADLAALLLTTEPEIRYFTGFLTRFWESPTRPWFLIVPVAGNPVAVIPSIGQALMSQTWITDVRTWTSPNPADDGVSLLADTLSEVARSGKVGLPDGSETHLRMPIADLDALKSKVGCTFAGDAGIMRRLRVIKSVAEIAKIRHSCDIAGRAFSRMAEIARLGVPLEEVFRRFQMLCLDEGADWVPYLAGASDPDGYADVISPATGAPLAMGDVLMLDTGLVWDGYFCDYDRNFAVGTPSPLVADAHARLIDATEAGFAAARPGATAADVFHAMDAIVTGGTGTSEVGRLGHGLGMQLTEWPSFIPEDQTPLLPGMVLTLEPSIEVGQGRFLVHEENIVIGAEGASYLTTPAGRDLPVL